MYKIHLEEIASVKRTLKITEKVLYVLQVVFFL
jgi:hypothetical protein